MVIQVYIRYRLQMQLMEIENKQVQKKCLFKENGFYLKIVYMQTCFKQTNKSR